MILDQIVEDKKIRLKEHKQLVSESDMRRLAEEKSTRNLNCFYDNLRKDGLSIIGEFKKASPSLGKIESKINLMDRIEEYNLSVDVKFSVSLSPCPDTTVVSIIAFFISSGSALYISLFTNVLMLVAGHPPTFVAVSFILCVVIISANSSTNPQAVCEKPVVEHSLGVDVFAIRNVCVPYVPISTVLVSPTLYLLILFSFTAVIIVSHESVLNDTGFTLGIYSPSTSIFPTKYVF